MKVLDSWSDFLKTSPADVKLIVGNHDRHLTETLGSLSMQCLTNVLSIGNLMLSHEPYLQGGLLKHLRSCASLCADQIQI